MDIKTMIKQVCMEMFEIRGYRDIHHEYIGEDEWSLSGRRVFDDSETIVRLFINDDEKSLNVKRIKHYYTTHIQHDICNHLIIVNKNKPTPAVHTLIKTMTHVTIELFRAHELYINVTRHRLVPQHIKIGTATREEAAKLPKLLITDIQSRFRGYAIGDVIKIIRRNGGYYYRVVS